MKSSFQFMLIHGIYYFITGIWPILHIHSFMEVTGYKTDIWLVKTVGGLITAISIYILSCCYYRIYNIPFLILAVSSALILAFIDIYYVLNKTISVVYLVDAIPEIIIILTYLFLASKTKFAMNGNV